MRLLFLVTLTVCLGCCSTHTKFSVEYAVPSKYGDGKVAVVTTITR